MSGSDAGRKGRQKGNQPQTQPASFRSSGQNPRPASLPSSGQNPRPASLPSSGQNPRPASSTSSGQNPRPASSTSSGQNPQPASTTSSRPASSTSSRPALSQSKERQPEVRSTGRIKAGTEAATKGKHCGVTSGAQGPSTVKGKYPTAASRPGNLSHQDHQKHMASSRPEEDMDWQVVESGGTFDMTPFIKMDKKSPSSSSTVVAERSTGKDHHTDSDWTRLGDKGQAQGIPSSAGGEGQQDDSEEGSEDPDEGGYVDSDWETDLTKKPSLYDNKAWKGEPLKNLKTTPKCLPNDLKLERSSQHDIAILTPFEYRADRLPAPLMKPGRWDADHVRMPSAVESKCVVNGKEERRWNVIVEALQPESIRGPFELEEAILKYNQRYVNKWKFTVLHHFFIKHVDSEEREQFFDALLPQMIRLALKLPDICPMPIPLLKKHKAKKLTLSQHQISCLLANAFFCTFPLRNARTRATEYAEYPDINFSHLFVGEPVQRKLQKMHCIINYFKRVIHRDPAGIVTFTRQVLPSPHNWFNSMETLSRLHVSSTGTIEDDGRGMLQVDFANKYLGGGVLGHGCVQEEIRFMICPEMIITRLFTQSLDPLESLVMTGCERFNDYEGYSDTFRWKGDYTDRTARDYLGRLCCEVVAIDAQVFRSDHNKQFKRTCIERELNKAYCGFKSSANEGHRSAVCTGKWGCGAFRGDKQLKALIQVMAASVAKRDICFFTFGDEELTKDLFEVHDRLRRLNKTVGDVYCLLEDYGRMMFGWHESRMTLFEFINNRLDRDKEVDRYHPAHNYNTHFASNTDTASGNASWFVSQPEDSDTHGY